jgi:hypothetical protein
MLGARVSLLIGIVGVGLIGYPVLAQDAGSASQRPYETQLRGLTADESAELVTKLNDAQDALRRGDPLYFELLSGAPASYPMTATSPREAFLSADFSQPFEVERLPPDNPSWKPHRLTLLPNGLGNLLWDIKVVLGFYGDIARVEMFYRPPHPF